QKIPLQDGSVDLVVSLETIEHVPSPDQFLDECVRVLAPRGRLVISTPDKEVYTDYLGARNVHHCSELTHKQFATALRARFRDVHFYTQRIEAAPWWSPRTLACENTAWLDVRGFRRLRRAVQLRLFQEAVNDPTAEERALVSDLIPKLARSRRSLLNRY